MTSPARQSLVTRTGGIRSRMDFAVADGDVVAVVGDADVDVDVGTERSEIGDERCGVSVAGVLLET